ncbi:MAG: hypothetical protein ACXQS3_02355 [Candidatus Methanofastidiosia archaeon]
MKDRKIIVLSILLSIAGVGFLFFEADNTVPIKPRGPLAPYVGSYVSVEGVVSRKLESKGNLFLVIKGDHEVEIPLFYGLKECLSQVPELGDWVCAQGILSSVKQEYLRQYWPHFFLDIEKCDHIEILPCDYDSLPRATCYTVNEAGSVLQVNGKVTAMLPNGVAVGDLEIETALSPKIGDMVEGFVLIVEDHGKISNMPLKLTIHEADITPLSKVQHEGTPYLIQGTVKSVKSYYKGILLEVDDSTATKYVYSTTGLDVFPNDTITARGLYRQYYHQTVLYVPSSAPIGVQRTRGPDNDIMLEKGKKVVVMATVDDIYFKGSHQVLKLDAPFGIIQAHIYATEKKDLLKRGKDATSLKVGCTILVCLEIITDCKLPDAKIIDFELWEIQIIK